MNHFIKSIEKEQTTSITRSLYYQLRWDTTETLLISNKLR